ncbi:DEAD/DEAH box helicase [Desulfitobacterium sp. Sab5]|uniref:DEAD/DEAH box helicase n=1 Tax=Desulfitobacterium nosdiversum TaxID=3375356 RepID=UPI003CE80891
MEGIRKFDIKNLVLSIDKNYNRAVLDIDSWQDYLDCLCSEREYQKTAIKTAVIYLMSAKYSSINDLAEENYYLNEDIRTTYKTLPHFLRSLQMPNILSGVLDMATGSGKSFVIFGIAQILMSMGFVKRVLVLCPSLTIETELNKKFLELISKADLQSYIPEKFKKSLRITNANNTISANDICIENIHAVYSNTETSIDQSFINSGSDTLILSDEVHHAYNTSKDSDIKKWKEFVLNPKYGFKYHIGFTGTAYCGDDYFNDVFYRYSLRQAITDKVVKRVNYVDEETHENDYEKFQKILHNHNKSKTLYSGLKPLSIIVTSDINSAKILYEDFVDFLVSFTNDNKENVKNKVLIVTSHKDHKANVQKLPLVDDKNNPIEWIISVSMLTEGWDVQNVFQVVPWEDRAFNSKLLIAQVLGRGLRIPKGMNTQPSVRVFNHSSWSKNIRKIVDEILENEASITSSIIQSGTRAQYNFLLYKLNFDKVEQPKFNENYDEVETFDISQPLALITQDERVLKSISYIDTSNKIENVDYQIFKETKTITEVAAAIVNQYKRREKEANIRNLNNELVFNNGETEMDRLPSYDEIVAFIKASMESANIKGDKLTYANIEKINGKFTGLLRKKRSSAGFVNKVNAPEEIKTNQMAKSSDRYTAVKNGMVVYYSSDYKKELSQEELEILEFFSNELPGKQMKEINVYNFKTPSSVVVANKEPETKFIELLTRTSIAGRIDAWIKSRDTGFYSLKYILKRGSRPKEFNPDFFIKIGDNIAVIETKADNDVSKENYSKMVDARKYFSLLNEEMKKTNKNVRYAFNILTPKSYPDFEGKILDGTYFNGFNSELEIKLLEAFNNKNDN